MDPWSRVCILTFLILNPIFHAQRVFGNQQATLQQRLEKIDQSYQGNLGVYFKRLSDGFQVSYNANRDWYLASTIKVPVAIVLMQKQQAKEISLDEEIRLQQSDLVDGSGDLVKMPVGSRFKIRDLLARMLTQSDSVAADLLIKRIGVAEINSRLAAISPGGFKNITTLLQVRHDAYGRLHPRAVSLTNTDFIHLKELATDSHRFEYLAKKLGVKKNSMKFRSIGEMFESYYMTGSNSGSLREFGGLLEKLFKGELLTTENTNLLLDHMEKMETGDKRIKAGLQPTVRFAQKTGTQVRRVCNIGILRGSTTGAGAAVVAACMEKFNDQPKAVEALREVGLAISSYLEAS